MLATIYRLLFFIGIAVFVGAILTFARYNQNTTVMVHTPLGSDTYLLYFFVPACVGIGMLLMFFVMSVVNISQSNRMRRVERELRDQVREKERQIVQTDNRLAEFDAQTREFMLQVMQITHALGAPLKAPPGLALPQRHDGGANAGDES